MSVKIAFGQFFFVALVYGLCGNPFQTDGKCTRCGPLDVLIEGNCEVKMRGCLTQKAGNVCGECQPGYVLSRSVCIREAVYYNNTDLASIPPVQIDNTGALHINGKPEKQPYNMSDTYFQQVNMYFRNRHTELGRSLVFTAQNMETRKGVFSVVEY
jgi:hypothetical protein